MSGWDCSTFIYTNRREPGEKRGLTDQGLAALGPDAHHPYWKIKDLLQTGHVCPGVGGELLEAGALGNVLVEAGHCVILALDVREHVRVGGEEIQFLTVVSVAGANLELLEAAEGVQVQQGKLIDAANSNDVVSPSPVAACRATSRAVTKPVPFTEPAECTVTESSAAVVVPSSWILPAVVVV